MKLKLANTVDEGIIVDTVSRQVLIHEPKDAQYDKTDSITVTVKPKGDNDFETYKTFFENGDVTTMSIYDSEGELIATLNGKYVDSINQNISGDANYINVSIIA